MPAFTIKKVGEQEFEQLFSLIVALADFEKLPPPNAEAKLRLKEHCCSIRPKFEAYLAYSNNIPVAYAIIFETYSSFLAKPTLYLEDIFVLPEHRRQKLGVKFFNFLVDLAVQRNCGRMEWQVLDWNTGAVQFYEKLGATHMKEWFLYRLTEENLKNLHSITGKQK